MLLARVLLVVSLICAGTAFGADAPAPLPLAELAKPGRVLMLRHALAPGTGDPAQFRVDDCATQRNLDDTGRAQARAVGDKLRAAGIANARLWSSQWCRCLETARLLEVGAVQPLPALNSFFGKPQESTRQVAELRAFLSKQPMAGAPIVLVTHQVMVTAHTGGWVDSGGGALFARETGGKLRYLGPADLR